MAVVKWTIASHQALWLGLRRSLFMVSKFVPEMKQEDQCGEAKTVRRAFDPAVRG